MCDNSVVKREGNSKQQLKHIHLYFSLTVMTEVTILARTEVGGKMFPHPLIFE